MRRTVLVLGLLAVLSLSGALRYLPPWIAFFLTGLSTTLFPGMVIWRIGGGREIDLYTPGERLVVWFAAGAGVLTLLGFAGILLQVRLGHLMLALAVVFAAVLLLILTGRLKFSELDGPGVRWGSGGGLIMVILLCVAVGAGLLTTLTPRDGDDWYYTAHIADYAAGTPIASEDAVFGEAGAASGRSWFGGWWVAEALLARASGIGAVDCHQVYLPLMLAPFAVLAVFALARQLFQSVGLAVAACCFQILYYVSSTFPHQSAGWMLFSRTAQDKSVSALIMVPVALTLFLGLRRRADEKGLPRGPGSYLLFILVLVAATVVHPQGIVWAGVLLLPFAVLEALRLRSRRSLAVLCLLLLTFGVSGGYLLTGRETLEGAVDVLQDKAAETQEIPSLESVYLPGETLFSPEQASAGYIAGDLEAADVGDPIRVTRYPIALLGVIVTIVLLFRVGRSFAARFLVCVTLSVLFLVFTPPGAALSARIMTFRTLYRLTWVLPWGLSIALALSGFRLSTRWVWLVLVGITLLLARGNPANYVKQLAVERWRGRPTEGVTEALRAVREQAGPQGIILSTPETGRFVAGFAHGAYPVYYRGEGAFKAKELEAILSKHQPDEADLESIRAKRVRYILLENDLPLAKAIKRGWTNCTQVMTNKAYTLWSVPPGLALGEPRRPGPNIILITISSMRRDHLGCYGYDEPTSPAIDALAEAGVRFGNVVCQSPQTSPSLASAFTGMNIRTHGALSRADTLDDRFTTMAEVLAEHGYLTSAFVSGYELDSCGLDQGFDLFWRVYDHFTVRQVRARYERREDPTTEAVLAWLETYKESPFFLWVHWPHPQRPYDPPGNPEPASGRDKGQDADRAFPSASEVNDGRIDPSADGIEGIIARYDDEIAFADIQVARVLDRLAALGLADSTIVVLTADHGEMLYDHHRYFSHDVALYDEAIMVPLIIRGAQVSAPAAEADSLARSIDIMPTLLGILDVGIPEAVEGENLLATPGRSTRWPIEYAFCETFPFASEALPSHAVRTIDAKLIWRDAGPDSIEKEFYDLRNDPEELDNLYSADNTKAARLDSTLTQWIGADRRHPVHVEDTRKGRTLRLLRRLGYTD